MNHTRIMDILLVEDNEADVILTREAFKVSKLAIKMDTVDGGEKCMAYLRHQGAYRDAPARGDLDDNRVRQRP